MRILKGTAALIFCLGAAVSQDYGTASAQERRGVVERVVATTAGQPTGVVRFTVSGTNPCGAVHLEFGDGTPGVTYPIRELPASMEREYTTVGTFAVQARGMGNCDGSANGSVRVTSVRPQPPPPTPTPAPVAGALPGARGSIRFATMDANNDGIITREEWRGSQRSFELHDWNGDGRLSGDEIRIGATWPPRTGNPAEFNDWSRERFTWLDVNKDNRISRTEWRYNTEDFFRVDRNGDNVLTLTEFLIGADDDDRGDRFVDLDLNGDGRLDRKEWHGSTMTFSWLDRNRDNFLSRAEVAGSDALATGGTAVVGTAAPRTVVVSARQAWHDTGIDVRVGDLVSVRPTGTINFSRARGDVASPAGIGQATGAAPRPDLPIGALLGRIGTDGEPFLVGRSLDSLRATRAGRVFLGVNDDVLDDNSGQFRAVVSVIRR
jgi:hypothetical protein